MKRINFPNPAEYKNLLRRPETNEAQLNETVTTIFSEIRRNGDQALFKYTALFDGMELSELSITEETIATAASSIPVELKQAIATAHQNITKFHEAQRTASLVVETQPGVQCWQEKRPIEQVGIYVPGGSAPLFSTVLMLAIPAKLAGCDRIVLCTPPKANGMIAPEILYAAQLCGVNEIYSVGGIQAIGALTFGTDSIAAVDKIFGPGNSYVTAAKTVAQQYGVAIDMPAGPSEVLVVADETANPAFVATDLLSQAEHGADSQVLLVSTSENLLTSVSSEIEEQVESLPRKETVLKALDHSKSILVANDSEAIRIVNTYAPEHLILATENAREMARQVMHAGSVFLGNYTPESAGDYASGTNHTLPTNGFARQYSGVSLDSFLKSITFQEISKEGLQALGPAVACMAAAEGLEAHKRAVTIRLNDIEKK